MPPTPRALVLNVDPDAGDPVEPGGANTVRLNCLTADGQPVRLVITAGQSQMLVDLLPDFIDVAPVVFRGQVYTSALPCGCAAATVDRSGHGATCTAIRPNEH